MKTGISRWVTAPVLVMALVLSLAWFYSARISTASLPKQVELVQGVRWAMLDVSSDASGCHGKIPIVRNILGEKKTLGDELFKINDKRPCETTRQLADILKDMAAGYPDPSIQRTTLIVLAGLLRVM